MIASIQCVTQEDYWKLVLHEKNYSPDCTDGKDEDNSGYFQCAVHLPVNKWNWHKNFFNPCIRCVLMGQSWHFCSKVFTLSHDLFDLALKPYQFLGAHLSGSASSELHWETRGELQSFVYIRSVQLDPLHQAQYYCCTQLGKQTIVVLVSL